MRRWRTTGQQQWRQPLRGSRGWWVPTHLYVPEQPPLLDLDVAQVINGGRLFLPGDALRRGTTAYGSGQRMERLGAKLLAGQPVTVTFLGGSITWGRVSGREGGTAGMGGGGARHAGPGCALHACRTQQRPPARAPCSIAGWARLSAARQRLACRRTVQASRAADAPPLRLHSCPVCVCRAEMRVALLWCDSQSG